MYGKAEQFDDMTMLEVLYKKRKVDKEIKEEEVFNADVNELPKVREFIEHELEKCDCSMKVVSQINLAVEEIFVNIAKYAYGEKNGNCKVKIYFNGENTLEVTFEDSGLPFNPLTRGNPDTALSADEREIGGLGIYIIKEIMDDVQYMNEDGKNILVIKKYI